MTYSEALDEHGISLGPKSTEDVLHDHSSDSWTHNLSFVMILGGWVVGSSHLWHTPLMGLLSLGGIPSCRAGNPPTLFHRRKYTRLQASTSDNA